MKVQKKERTDNPLTDHSDEAEDSVDIVKAPSKDDEPQADKVVSTEPAEQEDDEPSEGGLTPRQQKKRDRYDEIQRRAEEAERRALEAEHRAAAFSAHLQAASQMGQQRQADPLDDEEKRYDEDWKKHMALADTLSKGSTVEQQNQWKQDYLTLQKRSQTLAAKRAMAEAGIVPGQPVNHDLEARKAYIRTNYPDIAEQHPDGSPKNPRALMLADGLMRTRLAEQGRSAPSMQDYDVVFKETRRRLRMPGAESSTPSDETRRKFSGHGLGGSNGARAGSASDIRMNEDMMKMAEAAYSKIRDPKTGQWRKAKPEEAHAKWAQGPGKKVLAKYQ